MPASDKTTDSTTSTHAKEQGAVAVKDEPHHNLALDTPIGRAYWVELAPGESTMLHRHTFDYVTVVIGDALVGDRHVGDEQEKVKAFADGSTFYSRAVFEHYVRNAGKTPFYNFTVSMLRSGSGPENSLFQDIAASGDAGRSATTARIFDERSARAAEVLLKAGDSLDLRGDTIAIIRDTALAPSPQLAVKGESVQHIERTISVAQKRRLARLRRPAPLRERTVHLYWCSGRTRVTALSVADLILVGIR